jgi:hypothetical protein
MIPSLRDIIRGHQRRLAVLELQRAQQGYSANPSLIIEIDTIYKELGKLMIRNIILKEERPLRFKGLMVLIGPGRVGHDPFDQSAMDAITYHQRALEHCWMIGSSGTQGSQPVIESMQERCEHLDIHAYAHYVDDPFSVQETYELIDDLYTHAVPQVELREEEVIADITGATKPMSFGMLRACGTSRPMQYMVRQTDGPSLPMLLRYTLRTTGDAQV